MGGCAAASASLRLRPSVRPLRGRRTLVRASAVGWMRRAGNQRQHWWWGQSAANRSLPEFPDFQGIYREIANFRGRIGPRSAPEPAGSVISGARFPARGTGNCWRSNRDVVARCREAPAAHQRCGQRAECGSLDRDTPALRASTLKVSGESCLCSPFVLRGIDV